MSEDKTAEQKGGTMPVLPQERGITRRALLKGAAAAGGALALGTVIDRARQVFGQPPPYRVELPIMAKRAEKMPEIKQGMYGIWQKDIGFEQNGYKFGIENGEKAGLVVRNWQPLLRLTEHYGQLHGYKSFTVSFKDESELTPEMKKLLSGRRMAMAYRDDPESDQVLFFKQFEYKPPMEPYGRYGQFAVFEEYREAITDDAGNLHLYLHLALLNRDKYERQPVNFDPFDVLPRRITEDILLSLLFGAKTNEEDGRLGNDYLAGRGPYLNKTAEWSNEYRAPGYLHEPYLFQVVV